jgi:hypothetical protein
MLRLLSLSRETQTDMEVQVSTSFSEHGKTEDRAKGVGVAPARSCREHSADTYRITAVA